MPLQNTTTTTFAQDVLNSERPVLVDFWGPWHPPCAVMEKTLEDMAAVRTDVTVARLRVDQNMPTAEACGIYSLPTLLLFRNGRVLAHVIGAASKDELNQWLDERLANADPGIDLNEYKAQADAAHAAEVAAAQVSTLRTHSIVNAGLKTAGGLAALFLAVTTGMAAAGAVTTMFNAVRGVSLYRHKDSVPELRHGFAGRAFSAIANAGTIGSGGVLFSAAAVSGSLFVSAGLVLAGGLMLLAGGKGLLDDGRSLRAPRP